MMNGASSQSPAPALAATPRAGRFLPFVRYRWIWFVMIPLAYPFSFLWLNVMFLFVPVVIFVAPLGLVYLIKQGWGLLCGVKNIK